MSREICFGDKGDRCVALTKKECEGCNFYKPKSEALAALEATPCFSTNDELQKIAEEIRA